MGGPDLYWGSLAVFCMDRDRRLIQINVVLDIDGSFGARMIPFFHLGKKSSYASPRVFLPFHPSYPG